MNTVITTIPFSSSYFNLITAGNYVYVYNNQFVSVLDSHTNTIVTTITLGNSLNSSTLDTTNNLLYFSDYNEESPHIAVINPADNSIVASIPIDGYPDLLNFVPYNDLIYATDDINDVVYVIDPSTNTLISTIPVGERAYSIRSNCPASTN
jgi:YVTN family beta-propeller protein